MTMRRLGLQIFSLGLAITVWFFLHGVVTEKSGVPTALKTLNSVDVRLMGEPLVLGRNMVAIELEPRAIDIRVRGPENVIIPLSAADILAYIDVTGLTPGKMYSPVVRLVLPLNVELVGAVPLVRVEIKERHL
jgi:hypothetical protein